MVFSTIIFLFRFLPITLALYYLAPAKLKNTVLFLCSLVFYCWGEVRFFPVMVALILINYISGLCIEHFDQKPALRRTFLLVALIGSLGMLFYFKYANFVLRSVNALLGTAFAALVGLVMGWLAIRRTGIYFTASRLIHQLNECLTFADVVSLGIRFLCREHHICTLALCCCLAAVSPRCQRAAVASLTGELFGLIESAVYRMVITCQ